MPAEDALLIAVNLYGIGSTQDRHRARVAVRLFTRRDLLLKASKAKLSFSQMPDVLRRARRAGLGTSFTYIVGLDPLAEMRAGIARLAEHITEFPNLQVYQAHNAIMAGARAPHAEDLEFYLRARVEIEELLRDTGLRPQAWERGGGVPYVASEYGAHRR